MNHNICVNYTGKLITAMEHLLRGFMGNDISRTLLFNHVLCQTRTKSKRANLSLAEMFTKTKELFLLSLTFADVLQNRASKTYN